MMDDATKTFLDTVDRLEPEIHVIDSGAGFASIAISLKRIADVLEWVKAQAEAAIAKEADADAHH